MPAPAAAPPAQLLDLLQFLPAQHEQQAQQQQLLLGLQQQQLQLPVAAAPPLPAQPVRGLSANGAAGLAAQQAAGGEPEDQPAMDLSEGGLPPWLVVVQALLA